MHRIFTRPLPMQSLLLGPFTRRAVALIAILAVQFVPALAVGLPGVDSGDVQSVQRVLSSADDLKVARVDTRPVPTHVVDVHPFGDVPFRVPIRNPVNPSVLSPEPEGAIPVWVQRASPQPASFSAVLLYLGIKPDSLCVRHASHVAIVGHVGGVIQAPLTAGRRLRRVREAVTTPVIHVLQARN